jgi:predicted SnoaL-like aldol condensation-catalyzing enzyme
MKRYTLIFATCAVTIAFTACKSSKSATAANPHEIQQAKLDANKKLVADFYQSLFGDKDSTAIDKYAADNIKEHNPALQDGKEWLKTSLRPFLENPNIEKTKVNIAHIAADGDMVWLLVKDAAPNGEVFARVNIYRVENGKITEAWKVSEQVPDKSENTNTMF